MKMTIDKFYFTTILLDICLNEMREMIWSKKQQQKLLVQYPMQLYDIDTQILHIWKIGN